MPPARIDASRTQYFNDSTGEGELGKNARGPWNEGDRWEYEEGPAVAEPATGPAAQRHRPSRGSPS
jgi:hypothetical protein